MESLRHCCRHCRSKLPEPTDTPRRAFCVRGCFTSYYRSRCVVCEQPFRRKAEHQKTCIAQKCKAEARRFPAAYSWPKKPEMGACTQNDATPLRSAHSTGVKTGLPPGPRCLRAWRWQDEVELFNGDTLIARLEHNRGRYRLTYPRTWPILSWPSLQQGKHGAESLALAALPLDPATAARTERENSKPHPMGRPSTVDTVFSDWSVDAPSIVPDNPSNSGLSGPLHTPRGYLTFIIKFDTLIV